MSHGSGVSFSRIKHITEWMLTGIRDRHYLSIVNAPMPSVLACIICWQATEINRVINKYKPEESGIDLSLLEHVSPIAWDNVILYGEYVIDKTLIKP